MLLGLVLPWGQILLRIACKIVPVLDLSTREHSTSSGAFRALTLFAVADNRLYSGLPGTLSEGLGSCPACPGLGAPSGLL